jgi:hypothetical protein
VAAQNQIQNKSHCGPYRNITGRQLNTKAKNVANKQANTPLNSYLSRQT